MIQLLMAALLWSSFSQAAPTGLQESWSSVSDPLLMGITFETRFFALPLKGMTSHKKRFWSGDYWALNKGMIDYRWNAKKNFKLSPPTKEELRKLSQEEIAQLSPAEKFDLANGRYHYPLKKEVHSYLPREAKDWEGICHGWAPASLNHNEPTPKILINPDGIAIPFGSTDIKAILSYFYAYPYQVPDTQQVGRRCEHGPVNTEVDCKQDLNAGAFHIILANKVGLDDEGFVADLDRYNQVWNNPIKGFKSEILSDRAGRSPSSASGTTRLVKLKTTIYYPKGGQNHWNPVLGTRLQVNAKKTFRYTLEINQHGEIIGGVWDSLFRPDFLWLKKRPQGFIGAYGRLKELLND